jgi:hypothetical protein
LPETGESQRRDQHLEAAIQGFRLSAKRMQTLKVASAAVNGLADSLSDFGSRCHCGDRPVHPQVLQERRWIAVEPYDLVILSRQLAAG